MNGSNRFSLSRDDAVRIWKGFLIAAAGFAATYITTTVVPALQGDGKNVLDMALVAVFSVAANALRLFASDTSNN